MKWWRILKQTVAEFSDVNGTKLSASLSYYTIFSIAPMLFIVISIAGIFYGHTAIEGTLYFQIKKLVGDTAALQIQQMIASTQLRNNTVTGAVVGIITLVLGATGVFTEIQSSINSIWSVKAKPQKGWLKYIVNRLISFSLIIGIGFIMVVSLVINALLDLLSSRISAAYSDITFYIMYALNIILIFLVIAVFFMIVFKVLPDGKIFWKDAFKGAMFTSLLFLAGKFGIGYYLGHSKTSAAYGAAASLIIILLWVYYTSLILYFGAAFTKVYALQNGRPIQPGKNAVYIIQSEKKEVEIPVSLN